MLIQVIQQPLSSNIVQVLIVALGGGTIGVIAASFIQWARFRRKDKSETELVESQSQKTDAEAMKIKAEAVEIKAKAEATVADAALKLAQRLSEECDMSRKQLERTQNDLDKTAQQLRTVTTQLHFVQAELDDERHRNNVIMAELKALKEELDSFKKKYIKREDDGFPSI